MLFIRPFEARFPFQILLVRTLLFTDFDRQYYINFFILQLF